MRKGQQHSEDTKKKISDAQFGKYPSEETRKKMSVIQSGENSYWYGKHLSEETKKKIGGANRCKHRSEKEKQHLREINLGKYLSEETKKKLKEAFSGEKNTNWKGGISKEEYTENWTDILKESIRCRDNYTCRLCGEQETNRVFPVHHIDYDKKNCGVKNLITLCKGCHSKTNYNREQWIECFRKLDSVFV